MIPSLTQLRYLESSLRPFTQFTSAIATWKEKNNDISTRTFDSLQAYLLEQIGNIPSESHPRGGNAFIFRGKGKGPKGKKGKGRGGGRSQVDSTNFVGSSSYHQGYRAAIQDFTGKRTRSASPEVEVVSSSSAAAHPATAFRVTGLDDRDNDSHSVRSSKSHKSTHSTTSTNLHAWQSSPQTAPEGVTSAHKYCHWHGYNFSHHSRDCLRLQRDPYGNQARLAATKATNAPRGSSRVQLYEQQPSAPAPAPAQDTHRNGWE